MFACRKHKGSLFDMFCEIFGVKSVEIADKENWRDKFSNFYT